MCQERQAFTKLANSADLDLGTLSTAPVPTHAVFQNKLLCSGLVLIYINKGTSPVTKEPLVLNVHNDIYFLSYDLSIKD